MKIPVGLCALLLLAGCKEEPPARQEAEKAKAAAAEALKHAMKAAEAARSEAGEAAKEAGETAKKAADAPPKDLGEAMQKMQEAMGKVGANVDPVSYKKLKALLPEKAGDFQRKKTSGEKAAAMGVRVSHASGKYEGPNGAQATVKITDAGSMKGFVGMAGWSLIEIERESDEGFERTFNHEGHKAHEKYENASKRGEMHLLVSNRFVVEVTGRKVEMKQLEVLFKAIDAGALEAMKNEGVKSE